MDSRERDGASARILLPRAATPAELLVVRDALADPLVPPAERIRRSGLSRRTYQTNLRRVYLRRWIVGRYVPSPALTGLPWANFLLGTPEPGKLAVLLREAQGHPTSVHVWASERTFFAVTFEKSSSAADDLGPRWEDSGLLRGARNVAAHCARAGVSAYFDFEGEWGRYADLPGTVGYPHPLVASSPESGGPSEPGPSERVRATAETMVTGALELGETPLGSSSVLSRLALHFAQRSLILRRWVEARSFLNPVAVAANLSDFAEGVTWLFGTARSQADAARLSTELLEGSRVRPFLFASDGRRVAIGFLSIGPRTHLAGDRAPDVSVRSVVTSHLAEFTVQRESLGTLECPLNHRYDRLLPVPADR
jgi:hypothetical protein